MAGNTRPKRSLGKAKIKLDLDHNIGNFSKEVTDEDNERLKKDFMGVFGVQFWKRLKEKHTCNESCKTQTEKKPVSVQVWYLPNGDDILEKLHRMAEEMKNVTESAGYILYLKHEKEEEIFLCPKSIKDLYGVRFSWKIRMGKTIATYVIQTKEGVIYDASCIDVRFLRGQEIYGLFATNVITVPIINYQKSCFGVLELYRLNGKPYTEKDLALLSLMGKWVGQAISVNHQNLIFKTLVNLSTTMLKSFVDDMSVNVVASHNYYFTVMNNCKKALGAQIGTLLTLQGNEVKRVVSTEQCFMDPFNLNATELEKEKLLANIGFKSGWIINVDDIFSEYKFFNYRNIASGNIIRSCLVTNLGQRSLHHIGVVQYMNKSLCDGFISTDETISALSSNYCCMWYYFSRIKQDIEKQNHQTTLLQDSLFYHISKSATKNMCSQSEESGNLSPQHSLENKTVAAMIPGLLASIFSIIPNEKDSNSENLTEFLWMVIFCYRNRIKYNVEQMCSAAEFMSELFTEKYIRFSNLELYSLVIASLCLRIDMHDENLEQLKKRDDPLLKAYENSPLQNHWAFLARIITEGAGILNSFNAADQEMILNMIQENILATNFSRHLETLQKLSKIIEADQFRWNNAEHRLLLRNIVMMCTFGCIYIKWEDTFRKTIEMEYEYEMLAHKNQNEFDNDFYFHGTLSEYCKVHCKIIKMIYGVSYKILDVFFPREPSFYFNLSKNYNSLIRMITIAEEI